MTSDIYQALQQLSSAEKRRLGEALIDSADTEESAPLISDNQRAEIRARLAYHRANPDEPGLSFSQLKSEILNAFKQE